MPVTPDLPQPATGRNIVKALPRPPAYLAPYVEVLGGDLAIEFLLAFGGADMTFPNDAERAKDGAAARMVGGKRLVALADRLCATRARVPLGDRWLAAALQAKGFSIAEIARRVRKSDVTVRSWLNGTIQPKPHAKAGDDT